ncbi:MAG TPA: hypothetical protein VHC39_05270 [Rhizomicrobium sp.]|nr:hypothetical protein [Rhizomicrobium sp.]
MLPIAQDRLERICLAYLNHLERQRPVEALTLRRPSIGAVNWTLASINPKLCIQDVAATHAAIRELQQTFRMVTGSAQ